MIEPKELRIGNYILYAEDVVEVEGIKYIDEQGHQRIYIKNGGAKYNFLKPIPLTEEWLLKFVFEHEDLGDDPPYDWYKKGNFKIWDFNGEHWIAHALDQEGFNIEIKYVHQLQNLYFALTGEELTIEE